MDESHLTAYGCIFLLFNWIASWASLRYNDIHWLLSQLHSLFWCLVALSVFHRVAARFTADNPWVFIFDIFGVVLYGLHVLCFLHWQTPYYLYKNIRASAALLITSVCALMTSTVAFQCGGARAHIELLLVYFLLFLSLNYAVGLALNKNSAWYALETLGVEE